MVLWSPHRPSGDGRVPGSPVGAPPSEEARPTPESLSRGNRLASLDGIRAVAVIGVLLYHADVISGGYLGVDVFFVLSGFLITVLLTQEHTRTGAISVPRFWFRRVFRLVPALVAYLLAGLAAAWVLKPPEDWQQYEVDALTSLFGVNNWWRVISGAEATAWAGHLWSLAVEAQFYLVWPAVLLAVLALPRRGRRVALAAMIAAVAGWRLAIVLGVLGGDAANRTYYGTDTRADALLAGALLALRWAGGLLERVAARVWVWAAAAAWVVLGATMLLAPTLSDTPSWLNHGGYTVIAVVAAVAVAGSVMAGGRGLDRFLGWAPVVWLGSISYAMYLWHYPITIELEDRFGARFGHLPVALVALVVTVGFAWASMLLVEGPVSRRRRAAELRVFGERRPAGAPEPSQPR